MSKDFLEAVNSLMAGIMSLESIEELIISNKGYCLGCEKPFVKGNINSHEHEGGIFVYGYNRLQWVYFHCDKCEYNSSLFKVIKRIANINGE